MTARALTIIEAWPAQMRRETAASYVDATSPLAFDKAVKGGLYPKPYRKKGEGMRWLKVELDEALRKLNPNEEDEFE